MKNTMDFKMAVGDDEIVIEGKCPSCMNDEELKSFLEGISIVFREAYLVAVERNIYGKKKQSTQKKRQKDFRKSSR